jgi:hypothetical protein
MNGTPARGDGPRRGAATGRSPSNDPAAARAPRAPLSLASHRLVIALHRAGQPIPTLARRFPHIVNRLSAGWAAPMDVVDVLDELLVDRRGGRRGFPADALAELLALRRTAMRRATAKLDAARGRDAG